MTVHIVAEIDGKQEHFHMRRTRFGSDSDMMMLVELLEPEPVLVSVYNVNNREVVLNKKAIIFARGDE